MLATCSLVSGACTKKGEIWGRYMRRMGLLDHFGQSWIKAIRKGVVSWRFCAAYGCEERSPKGVYNYVVSLQRNWICVWSCGKLRTVCRVMVMKGLFSFKKLEAKNAVKKRSHIGHVRSAQ